MGERFLVLVATSLPRGWEGEIGHGTSLQNIAFSTIKKQQLIALKHNYILTPDYYKIRISEQGVV